MFSYQIYCLEFVLSSYRDKYLVAFLEDGTQCF